MSRPVLLVDDDLIATRMLKTLLSRSGHSVISADRPEQVLPLIESQIPCLVLLDVNMPGMDGITLLGKIRAKSSVPVVMLTGLDSSEHAVRALRLGAYDYLTKPVDGKKLLGIVSLAIGTEIDPTDARTMAHYELRRELGRGGMGIVYEAHDRTLDRRVALKVLQPEFSANSEFEIQFLAEARAAARVSHPGLVAVYEAGRHRGRLFIAMELVKGMTLSSALSFTPLEAMHVIARAAEALGAAHAQGLVHRDVKPSNIMVTSNRDVKVLDFGLVHIAREELPWSNYCVGTPGYASPEAILGGPVDRRSDVFSLGVVLYELLAGDRAFQGSSAEQIRANVVTGQVGGPALTHLPPAWRLLVERMMSTDPARRPCSMFEVASEIRRTLANSAEAVAAAR